VSSVGPTVSAAGERASGSSRAPSRREILALAGVLTATLLTMAAAVAGLTRKPTSSPANPPTVSQVVGPQSASTPRVEPGD
jgi:hypothetical protein